MSKFLKSGILALTALAVIGAGAHGVRAQSPITPILEKMDAHNKALTTLQADVAMSKFNAQIGVADPTSKGKVWYVPAKDRRQMYIRIDWISPVEEQLAIANGLYLLYRPKLNQAYKGTVEQAKQSNAQAAGPLAFLSMSRQQLKDNYTVVYIGIEKVNSGQIATSRIQLTPKDQSKYKLADLWVDVDGMPVQAKVTSANGDTTSILLTNVQKNRSINGKIFSISLPSGVKILQ